MLVFFKVVVQKVGRSHLGAWGPGPLPSPKVLPKKKNFKKIKILPQILLFF
jgi:hypothetical protein